MVPNPWLAFTFFGIPFAVGLLAGIHSLRLFWRGDLRYRIQRPDTDLAETPDRSGSNDLSFRTVVLRGLGLLVVSAVLLVHSGRWLLSIYGYL